MALIDRDIIITPNRGAATEPNIKFIGADASSSGTITLRVLNTGTMASLSFEGSTGQLFSLSDTFTGTIFSVNDVSGIPSIEVIDTGEIRMAQYSGFVDILSPTNATSTSTGALQVVGGVGIGRDVWIGGSLNVSGGITASVSGTISTATTVTVTDDASNASAHYPTFVAATSGNQSVKVDSSGLIWIPSTNRLGIGGSPTSHLHIQGSGTDATVLDADHTGFGGRHVRLPGRVVIGPHSSAYPGIYYNAVPTNAGGWNYIANDTAYRIDLGNSNRITLAYAAAGTGAITWTDGFILNNSGNVGIGVAPTVKLHVNGGATGGSTPVLRLVSTQSDTFNWASSAMDASLTAGENFIHLIGQAESTKNSGYIGYKWSSSGSNSNLLTFGHYNSDNLMNLTADGNLGIGVEAPGSKLEVRSGFIIAGTATTVNGSKILAGYYTNGYIATWGGDYSSGGPIMGYGVWPSTAATGAYVSASAVTNLSRGAYHINGNSHVWYIGAAQTVAVDSAVTMTNPMTLNSNGLQVTSLGIGTAPSGTTGEIRATNEITAYYSDRRLKDNVVVIENAVAKVKKLQGITYTPNELAEKFGYDLNKKLVGLFADEVESVLPEAVRAAPFDLDENGNSKSGENYKTVQYEKIVPLLVEAIKEQQRTIDQILSELKNLATK